MFFDAPLYHTACGMAKASKKDVHDGRMKRSSWLTSENWEGTYKYLYGELNNVNEIKEIENEVCKSYGNPGISRII